jgi:predicted RNase H-like HicB family nuclease
MASIRVRQRRNEAITMPHTFTAVIHKEGDLCVADCPEVGTVSQGHSFEKALANLAEATELYLEEFPTHVRCLATNVLQGS